MWFPEDLENTPLIQEFRFDILCSIRLNEIYTLPHNLQFACMSGMILFILYT